MRFSHSRRLPTRTGFTLVELLVTITSIGILAGIVMGALNAARQAARVAKTKSTIAKLDRIIMRRYEEYATRRVPISTSGLPPKQAARDRLDALRDLMRMEMPERWNDITNGPVSDIPWPALTKRYLVQYNRVYNSTDPAIVGKGSAAECLYMIVATGSAEDREQFNESEIGDTDGDALLEFIDGWGTPIRFLRWAPGFEDSDIQPTILPPGNMEAMQAAALTDHDPFDTHGVDPDAYHLVPLIYSYGPDKQPGINTNFSSAPGINIADPFSDLAVGEPDGTGDHYDNIHNHHIEQR